MTFRRVLGAVPLVFSLALTPLALSACSADTSGAPGRSSIGALSVGYAKAHGVTTIYAETLASPAIAETIAREAGAKVSTLDPIEGLTRQSRGKDYFGVMRSNLTALRSGQGCS